MYTWAISIRITECYLDLPLLDNVESSSPVRGNYPNNYGINVPG